MNADIFSQADRSLEEARDMIEDVRWAVDIFNDPAANLDEFHRASQALQWVGANADTRALETAAPRPQMPDAEQRRRADHAARGLARMLRRVADLLHDPDADHEVTDRAPSQESDQHADPVYEAAKWAASMTFHEAGFTAADHQAAGIDVESITASCVQEARGDVGRAAGLAVSAAHRMLVNLRAQQERAADGLGVAPDRPAEREGRYDGSI